MAVLHIFYGKKDKKKYVPHLALTKFIEYYSINIS